LEGRLLHVGPQVGLANLRVRAVALEAEVGQDRQDVAAEIDRRRVGRGGGGGGDQDEGERERSPGHRPAPRDSGGGAGRGGTWILSSDTPPRPTPVGPDRHIAPGLPAVLKTRPKGRAIWAGSGPRAEQHAEEP